MKSRPGAPQEPVGCDPPEAPTESAAGAPATSTICTVAHIRCKRVYCIRRSPILDILSTFCTDRFSSQFMLCARFEPRNSFMQKVLKSQKRSFRTYPSRCTTLGAVIYHLSRPLQQSVLGAKVHLGFPFQSRRPQPSSIASDQMCQNQPTPP